jgi:hypothetical protein
MNDKQDVEVEVMSCHKLRLKSYMMMASYEERNALKPIMHEHDNQRELVAITGPESRGRYQSIPLS